MVRLRAHFMAVKDAPTPESDITASPTGFAAPVTPWAGAKRSLPPRVAAETARVRAQPGTASGAATHAAPLPRRPKGRLFVGTLLVSVMGLLGYLVWNALLRYEAYGVVEGRIVKIASPFDGVVRAVYVRDGDSVEQNQVLATVENIDARQQLARLQDELKVVQAEVASELSQLQLKSVLQDDRRLKALAEYYELWGTLLHEQSRLEEATVSLRRVEKLRRHDAAVSTAELESAKFSHEGQKAKVAKLIEAVEKLKTRTEISDAEKQALEAQLKPKLVRIESIRNELSRVAERIELGTIRASVAGRVVRTHRFAGEYAEMSHVLVEVVEAGSLRVVLYVPQTHAELHAVGDGLEMEIPTNGSTLAGSVIRLAEQVSAAPDSLARYYRSRQALVPVHVQPAPAEEGRLPLLLGSEVRLPASVASLRRSLTP
jgi:multidrug resistance efflux pump